MDQVQNMELSKDQIIQELIALLNQNQQKEAANNVFEMAVKRLTIIHTNNLLIIDSNKY